MALAPTATIAADFTFFGTCPTGWDNLTPTQKESCVGNQLKCKVEGHFVWAAAGPLLEQWNSVGLKEYSDIIAHGKAGLFRSSRHYKIPGHELRLLNLLPERETAVPFVIIISKDKDGKTAKDTVDRLQNHYRIGRYSLKYIVRQGNVRFTVGHTGENSTTQSHSHSEEDFNLSGVNDSAPMSLSMQSSEQPGHKPQPPNHLANLCGARIAVYVHSGRVRVQQPRISTIAAVVHIGTQYYALTVAHVFFEGVDTSKSWTDSGLYTTSESSIGNRPEVPVPRSSKMYEVVVESLWPHDHNSQADAGIESSFIGLVAPSLSLRRRDSVAEALPVVIWNAEMDWALIELRDPNILKTNSLITSTGGDLCINLPAAKVDPPNSEVLIAAGVSKEVVGLGLGTIGGILLPWSSQEIATWSVEAEIAVGDSGSLAISPQTGMVYGLVVAYDSDTLMTYILPILTVFESIFAHFQMTLSSESNPFSTLSCSEDVEVSNHLSKSASKDQETADLSFKAPAKTSVYNMFLSHLKSLTGRSDSGQQYIRCFSLTEWLLSNQTPQATYLDLLVESAYSDVFIVPVDPWQISYRKKPSLLVFSLLLELGRGDLIQHFLRKDLTDNKLPFSKVSLEQASPSGSANDVNFMAQVYEKQWAYCPLKFQLDMGLDLPASTIIPIQQKRRVNSKGGSSIIWDITVPEEFVGETLRQAATPTKIMDFSDNPSPAYRFALKTFGPENESLFRNERQAFRVLQGNPDLVRCLGDFKHGENYNIILQYGELDLDEYFVTTPPPALGSDIVAFWENMLGVARGLEGLHSFVLPRAGLDEQYFGRHGDVKPDNILSVGGNFKLADFGFSSFKSAKIDQTAVLGGTMTYSPPECSDLPAVREEFGRAADIWSLGCVFSIAATWVILGESGIQQYSRIRQQDIASLSHSKLPTSSGDCFHDGIRPLKEVQEWHKYLRGAIRRTDLITSRVLDLVDQKILLADPGARVSARNICLSMEDILEQSKRLVDSIPVGPSPRMPRDILFSERHSNRSKVRLGHYLGVPVDHKSATVTSGEMPVISDAVAGQQGSPHSNTLVEIPAMYNERLGSRLLRRQPESLAGPRTFDRQNQMSDSSKSPRSLGPDAMTSSQQSKPVLTMTIPEARSKMKQRPSVFSRFKPPKVDKTLSNFLGDRDMVFIIDNSESMVKYWAEAADVLEALAFLVHGLDSDGLDLYFSLGLQRYSSNDSGRLKEAMSKASNLPTHGAHTDMAASLSRVLSRYLKSWEVSNSFYKRKKTPRPLSIYVLTDGVWSGRRSEDFVAVQSVVSEFYTKLETLDKSVLVSERRVGIQFIRFGDDPDAAAKLQFLDAGISTSDPPNIIDTEAASGNVYKMLLGNFVDEFDRAGDDDMDKLTAQRYPNESTSEQNMRIELPAP